MVNPTMMPMVPVGGMINQQPQSMQMGENGSGNAQQSSSTNIVVNNSEELRTGLVERRFYASFFGCYDNIPGCLASGFCPCFYLCYVYRTYNESLIYPIFCPWKGAFVLRVYVRGLEKITGGICEDCFISHICCPCVLCQLQREFDHVVLYQNRCIVGTKLGAKKWSLSSNHSHINIEHYLLYNCCSCNRFVNYFADKFLQILL